MITHWSSIFAALLFAGTASAKSSSGGSKVCSHTGFYSKKVVPLCEKHYPEVNAKNAWLIQFYHPYVKAVHDSKDAIEKLAAEKELQGTKVGAVDCKENQEFCAKQGIRQAPTTRIIFHGNSREYEGDNTVEALKNFISESMQRFKDMDEALNCNVKGLFNDPKKDAVIPLCTTSFPPNLEAAPWLVTFYEKGDRNVDKNVKNTLNKLADKFGNIPPKKVDAGAKILQLRFGAIDCIDDKSDCEKFGVSTFPTVRFYRQGADPEEYPENGSRLESGPLKKWSEGRLKAMPKIDPADMQLKADMPEEEAAAEEKPKEDL